MIQQPDIMSQGPADTHLHLDIRPTTSRSQLTQHPIISQDQLSLAIPNMIPVELLNQNIALARTTLVDPQSPEATTLHPM